MILKISNGQINRTETNVLIPIEVQICKTHNEKGRGQTCPSPFICLFMFMSWVNNNLPYCSAHHADNTYTSKHECVRYQLVDYPQEIMVRNKI